MGSRKERKRIVDEDLGGISMEEFQERFRRLKAENAKLKVDVGACSSHVQRMGKGLTYRHTSNRSPYLLSRHMH